MQLDELETAGTSGLSVDEVKTADDVELRFGPIPFVASRQFIEEVAADLSRETTREQRASLRRSGTNMLDKFTKEVLSDNSDYVTKSECDTAAVYMLLLHAIRLLDGWVPRF